MHVAITGSSGLIGRALTESLRADGHQVMRIVRSPEVPEGGARWDPAAGTIDAEALVGVDAVVHLAGVGIADSRWSDAHKHAVLDSRVDGTTVLAKAVAEIEGGPTVLLSGSAIGYYGDTGDDSVDESSPRGTGYLADVCVAWEEAAQPAVDAGLRVAFLRTGVVQSTDGGSLKKQLLPFKLGVGGRIGDGQQWISWISIDDEVAAIRYLLDHDVAGPVNLTAPQPARNTEFTKALGKVLGRPTIFPVPTFALKLILGGEAAESLALGSQKVLPTVLGEAGFDFAHDDIETGLRAVLGK
ncbi:MAG: TIGR01777 family oxidoreductase [Actinomycetota bacterium]